ncbi:hypothetical protein J3A65_001932 [Rhizobium sp. PvP014]|nr:hypothetical protein [Rhizobium sp. PvP014]MBP2528564.1 hypothetical protein [Rhizobium sp. PvP099]
MVRYTSCKAQTPNITIQDCNPHHLPGDDRPVAFMPSETRRMTLNRRPGVYGRALTCP